MRLATTVVGVGEPTLVLLHGLASTRRIFDLLAPHLSRTHRVIAYDQRGHGESEKPDDGYTLDDFAGDVDEVTRRYGVTGPVLVGHSFGANVALQHATTHRGARGLVLVDGGLVEMHAHLSWDEAAARLAPPPDDPYANERWVREGSDVLGGALQLVEIRRSLFELQPQGMLRRRLTRERHLRVLRASWEQDVHDALARVACPALILACRRTNAPAEEQRRIAHKELAARRVAQLPNVTVRWLEDSVHDVPLQRPAELARAILAFARSLG